MNIALDNFTISIVSITETVDTDVTIDNPNAVLLIVPNQGYSVLATNFSVSGPLPDHVAGVTFFQSGANVECIVDFTSPFIMPANDVEIGLCLSGLATLIKYTINGTVNFIKTNVSLPSGNSTTYYGEGEAGTVGVVYTQAVLPTSGYYFPNAPTLYVTNGLADRYIITNTKTYDTSNNLIGVNFTVNYRYPALNITGDVLTLTANAYEIYNPLVEITGYSCSLSNILSTGETRTCVLFGVPGASYSLTYRNKAGTPLNTFAGIVDSTGLVTLIIDYPASSSNERYNFTLTGDLADTFNTPGGQSSTWSVLQLVQSSLIFGVTSSNTRLTLPANQSTSYVPGIKSPSIVTSNIFTVTSTAPMGIVAQPSVNNWPVPTTPATPPDFNYNISVTSTSLVLDSAKTTLTVNVGGELETAGSIDWTSILKLNNYIATPPTLSTDAATSITGTSAISGGNSINANNGNILTKGVQWSLTSDFAAVLGTTSNGTGAANYASSITPLSPGNTYYARAYASNEAGTGYGNTISFVTGTTPTIVTSDPYNIEITTADGGGESINNGGLTLIDKGIEWSLSPTMSTIVNTFTLTTSNTDDFSTTMSNLTADTNYYFRAFATNSLGRVYGAIKTFKTTTTPPIPCSSAVSSGGVGITDYSVSLDPIGGLIAFLFNPQGVPDKLEIIHGNASGTKVATTGMTTVNAGPFDNVYGTETSNVVPDQTQAYATDQFIGQSKGICPTRQTQFTAETGYVVPSMTVSPITYQQVVWWEYTPTDYNNNPIATVRVTGSSGTGWNLIRLCCPDGNCTAAPASREIVSLGYSDIDGNTSCDNFTTAPINRYLASGQTWANATYLYLNNTTSTPAQAGWYSDGSKWRYWTQSAFTSTAFCGT